MAAFKLVVIIIGILVFAVVNEWPLLDKLIAALLGLMVIAYFWSRLSLRSVAITRETATDRAQVGQKLTEQIEVRNRGRFAKLWLEVRDYSTLPSHRASRVIHVRGKSATRWSAETWCGRRGRFRIGPIVLRSGDPFGLFPSSLAVPGSHELIVYPATVDVSGFQLPVANLTGGSAAERRNPFVTPSVAGLREYVPGDSLNRISWTATARTGKMMVKEFDLDPASDLWLVLDLDRNYRVAASQPFDVRLEDPGHWPLEAWLDSTEEYAVTIAASLARRALDQGRNVGLIASGGHYEMIPADRSDRQYVKILETLAVAQADGNQPLAEVLIAEGRRFGRQTGVVVITSSTDESWVQALMEIVGRRVRAASILVEPDTFGPADSSLLVVSGLLASGVTTHLVKFGSDISAALTGQPGHGGSVGRVARG